MDWPEDIDGIGEFDDVLYCEEEREEMQLQAVSAMVAAAERASAALGAMAHATGCVAEQLSRMAGDAALGQSEIRAD